jgi:[ribosomal protein S5]-alanine N-acetyltransferase
LPDLPIQSKSTAATASDEKLVLRTPRLEIVAATLSLIETEASNLVRLGDILNAEIENWPPPGNDANSLQWSVEKLRADPEHCGFHIWYVILIKPEKRTLVGLVAFKGPPDDQGTIEAGYSVLENYQRRGIGTEATRAIMQWAFESPAVKQITAETFPELEASIKVMKGCGMAFLGRGSSEPGAIRYGVTKEDFEQFLAENCHSS